MRRTKQDEGESGKVTLRDVAEAAGVSPATASRVLGKEMAHMVRPEVQEKVWEATRRLNYRYDYHARALRRGTSRTVALLMLAADVPITIQRINAIEREIWKRGYDTILLQAGTEGQSDLETLEKIGRFRVDGVLFGGVADPALAASLVQIAKDTPVVALHPLTGGSVDYVTVDRGQGAYLAARHFLELGHRRLGALMLKSRDAEDKVPEGPPGVHPTIQDRLSGIRRACEEFGCTFDERETVVYRSEQSYTAGYLGARALWEGNSNPPTAVLCLNDQLAIGALRAFQELNVQVPQQIALVGFDDLPEGAYARVPLTTLRQPVVEEARQAVERLFQRMARAVEPDEVVTVTLPPELVVRESCGAYLHQEPAGSTE